MLMSFFTTLPETSNLFLLGSLLIVAGLVLRRLRSILHAGGDSAQDLEPRSNTLELPRDKGLSQPVSPRI